jgi:thymidylate kinase
MVESTALKIISLLCKTLESEAISYCHWKSNAALARSASGDNDLDLLVSRNDAHRFTEILNRFNFKEGLEYSSHKLPGVLNYYGYDEDSGRIVHVHVHYQLILGHDSTKNYCLPIEKHFLNSAVQGKLFRVPSSEFEYVIFVIRMVLKHSTWDTILALQGELSNSELQELAFLSQLVDINQVYKILEEFIPFIEINTFESCVQALRPMSSKISRIRAGHQLQRKLKSHARRFHIQDLFLKPCQRVIWGLQRRFARTSMRKKLASGGAMIAVVGGDGAGKSTVVNGIFEWLSHEFVTTKIHLGKPPWSFATFVIRAISKAGFLLGFSPNLHTTYYTYSVGDFSSFPGYMWLFREIFTAWDRYRQYSKGRKFASNGGIVICDRYPLPQIKLMDGVQAGNIIDTYQTSKLVNWLVKLEANLYQNILPPNLLIILRVDPEIAVQRRAGEDPNWIRSRSQEIWSYDWSDSSAYVVDACKTKEEVLAQIKHLVWSNI